MFVIFVLLLTTPVGSKRIDRVKGNAALIDSDVQLQAISDPFEGSFSCLKSPDSGCKATGWKAKYNCLGSKETSISIKIKATGSTTIELADGFIDSSDKGLDGVKGLIGNLSFQEVREKACAPALQHIFPNACSFFTPGNLAHVCGLASATWAGDKLEQGMKVVKGTMNEIGEKVNKAQAPFDPLEGGGLGPLIQSGSGCTMTGWRASYFSMGIVRVLKVEIRGSVTEITADDAILSILPDGLKRFIGEHPTVEVAEMVCADHAFSNQFPAACPFFDATHLGLLCPASLGVRNVGKTITKGSKKLWGMAKGWFDKEDSVDE